MEQEHVLAYRRHLPAQVGQIEAAHVVAADQHAPGIGVVEARHQPSDGGLAGTRGPGQGHHLARRDGEIDAMQHRLAGSIGEGHLFQRHRAGA